MNKRISSILMMSMLLITLSSCQSSANTEAVKAVAVDQKDVEKETKKVQAYGVIKASSSKMVYIDFPAVVEEVFVKDGQRVKKGDKLVKLNLNEYERLIADKESELKIAELEYAASKKDVSADLERENIRKLKADLSKLSSDYNNNSNPEYKKILNELEEAKSLFEKEKDELGKNNVLFENGAISQSDLDISKSKVDSCQNTINSIQLELESLKNKMDREIKTLQSEINKHQLQLNMILGNSNIKIIDEEIKQLRSEISNMKSKMNQSFLKEGVIECEFDNGIITDMGINKGEVISEESKLFSIVDSQNLIVEADIAEEFYKEVKLGAEATIVTLADKTKKYDGEVIYISNNMTKKNAESLIVTEVSIKNADDFLFPNLNVELEIMTINEK